MYLFQKIEELMLIYQDARKNIAEFILNERDRILKLSMQEIADYTFTSKATLVRFAKTLGYSGWKEFIRVFMEESVHQETHYTSINPNFPFDEHDSVKAAADGYVRTSQRGCTAGGYADGGTGL